MFFQPSKNNVYENSQKYINSYFSCIFHRIPHSVETSMETRTLLSNLLNDDEMLLDLFRHSLCVSNGFKSELQFSSLSTLVPIVQREFTNLRVLLRNKEDIQIAMFMFVKSVKSLRGKNSGYSSL